MESARQPATPTGPFTSRAGTRRSSWRALRSGWALVRWAVLVTLCGVGAAVVIAALLAGAIVLITGDLP